MPEPVIQESQTLLRLVRDLAALSSLPAAWAGQPARDIVENLADTVQEALHPDLVYVSWHPMPDQSEQEALRLDGESATHGQAQDARKLLAPYLDSAGRQGPFRLPELTDSSELYGQAAAVGPDRTDGVLLVASRSASFPSEPEGLLLSLFANQAGAWGQQARLMAERQQAEQRLAKLTELELLLAAEPDLDKLAQAVINTSTALIGAQIGVFFFDTGNLDGQAATRYALAGIAREAFEQSAWPRSIALLRAAAGASAVRSPNLPQPLAGAHSASEPAPGPLPMTSYLAVPVTSRTGRQLGGLFFGHPQPDMFTEQHERLVVGLAALAGIGIDNARLSKAEQAAREQLEARVEARTSELLHSEARFQTMINSVQDYAIFMLDAQGRVATWNTGAARLKGYTAEEIIGQHFSCFYLPEDAQRGEPEHNLSLARQAGHYESEGWRVRKDHTRFWANVVITAVRGADGDLIGYAKVTRDLTERKRMEDALRDSREQLRQLSAHLEKAREEERARIAREIHDELGGTLTGLKMDVVQLRRHTSQLEHGAGEKLDELSQSIDHTVETVRRIASELRPAILDDFGLLAAMEWQLGEFERRSGIRCHWHSDSLDLKLEPDAAIAVFRVFQESLTNIARHAQASEVQVTVAVADDRLQLTIQDNGIGITSEQTRGTRSLGLVGMRERMGPLGGTVEIQGQAGQGTRVQVTVPLPPLTLVPSQTALVGRVAVATPTDRKKGGKTRR